MRSDLVIEVTTYLQKEITKSASSRGKMCLTGHIPVFNFLETHTQLKTQYACKRTTDFFEAEMERIPNESISGKEPGTALPERRRSADYVYQAATLVAALLLLLTAMV